MYMNISPYWLGQVFLLESLLVKFLESQPPQKVTLVADKTEVTCDPDRTMALSPTFFFFFFLWFLFFNNIDILILGA